MLDGASGNTTNQINIEEFQRVDILVARVIKAEIVPKSDKLMRLILDVGSSDTRQVVAGIAMHYEPEELTDRLVLYVSNLKPVTLRGVVSQGMLLAASDDKGSLSLATVDNYIEKGSKVS